MNDDGRCASTHDLWRLLAIRMIAMDREHKSLKQKRAVFKERSNNIDSPELIEIERESLARHIAEITTSLKADFQDIKRDYLEHRDEFKTMASGETEIKYVEIIERCLSDDFEKEFFDS